MQKTTIFVNGSFDLLHVGHIRLLDFARQCGDELIVGINTDECIRSRKGIDRPIYPLWERIAMLNALRSVDDVRSFSGKPLGLIQEIRPEIYVVGVDYDVACESCDFVRSCGGHVVRYPYRHQSTTDIVERLRCNTSQLSAT